MKYLNMLLGKRSPPHPVPTATPGGMTGEHGLRPEVLAFAHLMEAKLKKNDHKGGWKGCDLSWLFNRMYEEVEEIKIPLLTDKNEQTKRRHEQRERISLECADVANFAMMIADNVLNSPPPTPEA